MNNINIRMLTTMEQLKQLQLVEQKVWAQPPTPTHQTFTIAQNGGVILGAYEHEQMVGFVYSFPGFDGEKTYLHSHMLGILPTHRQGGLGEQLKLEQAKIGKKLGYTTMTWTFDPLESINAHLNIHKLRAVGAYYKENHYGSLKDGINQGLATDRIHIKWDLLKDRSLPTATFTTENVLLTRQSDGSPAYTQTFLHEFTNEQDQWFVAIPDDFQSIKQQNISLAKQWREYSRNVFNQFFSSGYVAINVIIVDINILSSFIFNKLIQINFTKIHIYYNYD